MMDGFRSNPPEKLGNSKVVTVKDYLSSEEKNLRDGKIQRIDLPKSNVLQFITEQGSIISARPSGTEPKIKFYCSVNIEVVNRASYDSKINWLSQKIEVILEELGIK